MYDLPDEIDVVADGSLRIITLNRPDALNAVNDALHTGLARLWPRLSEDHDARAAVLTGSGRAFSAGGDFEYLEELSRDPVLRKKAIAHGRDLVLGMARCRVPVVAAVNGPAVGLGCSLVALSDVVYMAETAYLADPHVQIGLVAQAHPQPPARAGGAGDARLRHGRGRAVVHHRRLSHDRRQALRREDVMTALRVVQWATGNIGARALRSVIEHPELTLAGVYVTSAAKAGKDAGNLCGLPATGVIATNNVDEILALKADCVLYMPSQCTMDEVCALLASGANVVTTRGEFHHPGSMDPEARAAVENACKTGGTSIHSTGSSPGFISEALPIALASIQRRLDCLTISEYANVSRRDSPDMLFNIMGFGAPPEQFDKARFGYGAIAFGPSLRALAEALGTPLDSVESTGEVAVVPETIEIAAGTLPKGTVAAQKMIVSGIRNGRTLLRFAANWYCSTVLDPAWEMRDTGWHVLVEGDAPLDVDIRFDVPLERMGDASPGLTANRAVNAVRVVCAAPAGIQPTAALPQIIANLG
ncbi:MAG TPA: enoyl-CoA hydratase-related protein [Trebonia sp.]